MIEEGDEVIVTRKDINVKKGTFRFEGMFYGDSVLAGIIHNSVSAEFIVVHISNISNQRHVLVEFFDV